MTPYEVMVTTRIKTDLVPLVQECIDRYPLPHPHQISDWYYETQEWLQEKHHLRPTRNQIARCLEHMRYRNVFIRGMRNWVARPTLP